MLTAEHLRSVLHYDPETGRFQWLKATRGRRAGTQAGRPRPDGYVRITIDRRLYYAHRLAWLYVTGEWPTHQIDHANCDPGDNRFCNLREATAHQNRGNVGLRANNTSGVKGVYWQKAWRKWVAYICPKGRIKVVGAYSSLEDAKRARAKAAQEYFGADFSREAV